MTTNVPKGEVFSRYLPQSASHYGHLTGDDCLVQIASLVATLAIGV